MRKATFFYLLRRGLLGAGGFVRDGLVMAASKFKLSGITHPSSGSAEFDGSSDYIQLDTPFSYTNHTIAAWVYLEPNAADKIAFDARDAGNDGILFYFSGGENAKYTINNVTLTSANVIDESWHYIVGTYDGTTAKLFIDGSQDQSTSTSQTISTTTDARIGARSHTSPLAYFNGNLANVAIWNRALSSDEINSVMWKAAGSLTDSEKNGLQAWYSLDNIDGTNVPDSSGNGNDGTAN